MSGWRKILSRNARSEEESWEELRRDEEENFREETPEVKSINTEALPTKANIS